MNFKNIRQPFELGSVCSDPQLFPVLYQRILLHHTFDLTLMDQSDIVGQTLHLVHNVGGEHNCNLLFLQAAAEHFNHMLPGKRVQSG
ncbi:hypothetical protein D3C81_1179460 [compost metagenome]